jgi:mannose-6-phosphate isomerase-like protein (cupin superfamily)
MRKGEHMTKRNRSKSLSAALAAGALAAVFGTTVRATPPSMIAFTPVGRATIPAFDVRRRFRLPTDELASGPFDGEKHEKRFWKIDLEATQPIDVATQIVTFQPGGFSGWHTHPGPVFFTVKSGTLTVYEGDDPACTPLIFPQGTGAVEAGTSTHIHMVRNETSSVAEALVTYLVPVGTPQSQLRTDLPYPGNCPF